MSGPRLLLALTIVNLALLLIVAIRGPRELEGVVPVLRGRGLEIVDDHGRVRASIQVLPADPKAAAAYPETVLLRLIDPNGRPSVKLGASVDGAGLGLGGAADPTYVIVKAEGADTSMKLTNGDGRERLLAP